MVCSGSEWQRDYSISPINIKYDDRHHRQEDTNCREASSCYVCVCVCVCGKKLRMQIILKQDGHLTSASSGLPIEPLVAMFNLWGTVLRGS